MNLGLVSVRYAKALLKFAEKHNKEEEVYEQAIFLQKVFASTQALHTALGDPLIPKAKKRKVVLTAFGGEASDVLEKFIDLLLENDRIDCLQNIMLKYQDVYHNSKNILRGKLTTAVEIDDATFFHLSQSVAQKVKGTLELEKTVDPTILGGFILELDDIRWDASLKRQLNSIRNQYLERNKRIV